MRKLVLFSGVSALVVAAAFALPMNHGPKGPVAGPQAQAQAPAPIRSNPDRDAYFGDLHLHTTYSFDAYVLMGTKVTPDETYRFAKGEPIAYLGGTIQKKQPLDFLAITDHSENVGVFNQLDDPNSDFSKSYIGKIAAKGGVKAFSQLSDYLLNGKPLPGVDYRGEVSRSTWQRLQDAANAANEPGKFTAFIAYEWTSMIDGANLHRNVIFKGDHAPFPFTSTDSRDPEDLWRWLEQIRKQGYEAIAIPHNANASNGMMYDWNTVDGKPIDEAYAQLRANNEILSEITQNKGSSDTHPALSTNDEFANYEIFDHLLIGPQKSKPEGSYVRDELGRGLILRAKLGINPYKDGIEGSSDLHSGLPVSTAEEYGGIGSVNIGSARLSKQQVAQALGYLKDDNAISATLKPVVLSPGALTGAWAESNTRGSIYAAFRRKETFATSGSRLKVRFFGGWALGQNAFGQKDWVRYAYDHGVPMGGDLPARPAGARAPSFAVWAVKDPNGGNLDRIQVIKVYVENGERKEHIFDVAWAGARRPGPDGKLPKVGDTVDLKTGAYANTIGAAELKTVWKDPTFKAAEAAVYYLRVLEIPTPRWSTLQAIQAGLPISKDVPSSIQQRAWSSPIWYDPSGKA